MVFTDLFDYSWQTALNRLLDRGHQLVLINILSPDEIDPQLEGEYRLLDSENGSFIELTSDFETLHAYRSHLANWQSEWAQFCSKRSAAYLPVSSRLPLEDLLFNQMQTAGVLK